MCLIVKYHKNNISVTTDSNGISWFKGVGVAVVLGYKYPRQTVDKKVPSDEKKKVTVSSNSSQTRCLTYINEPGVYRLIFSSKLPHAEKFKTWVFTEVLPRLRKSLTLKKTVATNERSLHYNVIKFMKTFYPSTKLIPGLGEYQETSSKRIDAWKKGYIGGQPDIIIPLTVRKYNGLAIELKNPINKSKVSPKQREYHDYLRSTGWKVIIGNNYLTVTEEIINYMNQVGNSCQICRKYYIYQKSLKNHMSSLDHLYNKKTLKYLRS